MLPTLPGVAAVLAIRFATWGGERTVLQWLVEMAAFGLAVGLTALRSERKLLREFRGYLGGRAVGVRSAIETSGS